MTPMGRAWVRKAEEDHRVLLQLRAARPRIHSSICFHRQQMAEKYLKALVHERGLAVPRTHDCEHLLNLLAPSDAIPARFRKSAKALTRFAVGPRYPDLFASPDPSHARSAWNAAERLRTEVRRRLGLRPLP